MADRKLKSLMNGIMGTDPQAQETTVEETITVEESSKPTEKPTPKTEKKGPGRPKKAATGEEDSAKGTFVADRQIIRKLKFIALVEDCLLKDVIDEAFKTYIEKWEKKNGEIPKPKR